MSWFTWIWPSKKKPVTIEKIDSKIMGSLRDPAIEVNKIVKCKTKVCYKQPNPDGNGFCTQCARDFKIIC